MSDRLVFATIETLAEKLRNGDISASKLIDLYAGRIEKFGASSKAFVSLDLERAREKASVIEQHSDNGSVLNGIPYACKDLFDVSGQVTTGGSKVLQDQVASSDADAVAALAADAVTAPEQQAPISTAPSSPFPGS